MNNYLYEALALAVEEEIEAVAEVVVVEGGVQHWLDCGNACGRDSGRGSALADDGSLTDCGRVGESPGSGGGGTVGRGRGGEVL